MSLLIQPLEQSTIKTLIELAKVIWHEHYDSLIGSEQVNYMLDKFQSDRAIKQQVVEGYQYFCAFENSSMVDSIKANTNLMGYFSIKHNEDNSLFISKFYLSSLSRGKGYGRTMLEFIENIAKEHNRLSLDLTVNKFNSAYDIYLKLGFQNVGSAQFDIGNGFIMDDYLLKKMLTH